MAHGRLHQPGRPRVVRRQAATRLLDMGVDCFKTDFGERIPTDVVWHDGSDPERMHNYYTYLYNQTVFDAAARAPRRGRGGACSPARRPPAASSSRCTGAATASRRSSRWRRACAAGCRWRCPASASGATTSAASRARPTRRVFKRWVAVRAAVLAQPAARQRLLPRAVAVRRGVGRRAAHVHPAEEPADAVPLRQAAVTAHDRGHAGDAADGRWSSPTTRPAATWTGSTCSATDLLVAPVFTARARRRTTSPPGPGPTC